MDVPEDPSEDVEESEAASLTSQFSNRWGANDCAFIQLALLYSGSSPRSRKH